MDIFEKSNISSLKVLAIFLQYPQFFSLLCLMVNFFRKIFLYANKWHYEFVLIYGILLTNVTGMHRFALITDFNLG